MNVFEEAALKVAAKSPCDKRKVGAVLVPSSQTTLANYIYGYNKPPKGECCENDDGTTKDEVIHAEVMALNELDLLLMQKSIYSANWTLYVTHQPCANCTSMIMSMEKRHTITIIVHVVEKFMKFDTGKLRYDLIPPSAMKGLAEVLTYGAKKYKPNNWKEVEDYDRYVAALYRHLEAWRSGEERDEESGLLHLSHALTNVAFLLELTGEK